MWQIRLRKRKRVYLLENPEGRKSEREEWLGHLKSHPLCKGLTSEGLSQECGRKLTYPNGEVVDLNDLSGFVKFISQLYRL